ncbi:MAG: mannose-1-phosphate guanylyltransferase, partial [Bdellovibrionales bacterium]|nr:mannose-1-phosphate guanylyltransferase [Bdellovibrionales bacterium]
MASTKVVILAGGQGARFWPISRMKRPKQFLSISATGESLIQATARRIVPLVGEENVLIVTNSLHEEGIREHVRFASLICEPVGRNTAPALGLAALHVAHENPETVMVCLPADHAVSDEKKLRETLQAAIELAADTDTLVTVGIPPLRADTAYGYIQRGAPVPGHTGSYVVSRFFEKPNQVRAQKYLDSGDFYWNSGMFAWRARVFLKALEQNLPEVHEGLLSIKEHIGTEREAEVTLEAFERMENISVDFGVMEHAKNCSVVQALPYGWNDVGSWDAWADHFEKDEEGNLLHGDALAIDSEGCVLYSTDRMVALVGAKDLIVIDAGDSVMVCPRDKVQDVRKIVKELRVRGREDLI